MKDQLEETLDQLTASTRAIERYARDEAFEELFAEIDAREKLIRQILADQSPAAAEKRKKAAGVLIRLDARANRAVRDLTEKYRKEISTAQVKYTGLIAYNNSRFHLESGQLVDKRR